MNVTKIGYLTLETPDLAKQAAYFSDVLGLRLLAKTGSEAFFACEADAISVVLRQGGTARCVALSLEVPGDVSFAEAAKGLTGKGVGSRLKSDAAPETRELLSIDAPEELQIDLTHARPASEDIVPALATGDGIAPRKLGHVAFNVENVQATVDFFVDILGFRVSDWLGDFFAFLRCGPDHHTVNFLHGSRRKMHHMAFEARDWNHLKDASDLLGLRKIPLLWGPGRHPVGHNLFTYHHNADGQIVELYAELDQMSDEASGAFDPKPWHEDKPQRPKVWQPGPFTSNLWGIPTPPVFRD
ncbi:VOC family protein [Roseiarcaceae bacterium H3SJ34-1]|uniref:VOC family protein n=1 Tax=Terripilifer ovatus TaxID=3032367 RepID=UPI003AB994C6|nr:VOC family protein [Roseiarcaceae bacterium H3SJ34-1]